MSDLTQTRLKPLLDRNPEAGIFIFKISRGGKAKGTIAGTQTFNGYRQIAIDGKLYYEHRLAWLYMHGVWPTDQLDHINNDRSDNRLCNLREASQSENNANGLPRVGRIGLRGAYYIEERRKWLAQIVANYQTIFLGYYDTAEKAHEAYINAAENIYGEFAYHNQPTQEAM